MSTLRIPNTNNKLGCQVFAHIFPAPERGIPESQLHKECIVECEGMQPFRAEIIDMIRFPLGETFGVITMHSDGMKSEPFVQQYLKSHPGATLQTEVAAYYFQKI